MQEFHIHQKFLIVVTGSTRNHTETLNAVFQILWKNGLMDSHVLIQDAIDTWSLYTFLPYQNNCVALTHLKIESFTSLNFSTHMILDINQVYPQKLRNFNGCPIYVAPTIFRPYFFVRKTSDGNYSFDGIENTMIKHISKSLNFTVGYKITIVELENGIFKDERNFTEISKLVL